MDYQREYGGAGSPELLVSSLNIRAPAGVDHLSFGHFRT